MATIETSVSQRRGPRPQYYVVLYTFFSLDHNPAEVIARINHISDFSGRRNPHHAPK